MKSLLVIGYVWPEPDSSAAGRRMLQLLEFFSQENYKVTFATTASKTAFMADLDTWDIASIQIELNNRSFDVFIQELDPDLVIFDRFMMEEQFGWRVSKSCPSALKILDTEDLHFLRDSRKEALKAKGNQTLSEKEHTDLAKREIASIYRCDLSLIISEYEMRVLQETYKVPQELLLYLPFMETAPDQTALNHLPGFRERSDFISIGNFLHQPNWDAVLNLKQHIWPLIRKRLPQAQLHVYGAYPGKKVWQLHNAGERFLVHGRADSALEVLERSRVLLAPLRFGAGLKGKFIDAIHSGTPFITTSLGGEGMLADPLKKKVIREDTHDFAEAAIGLYQDPELWKEVQHAGFEMLQKKFSREHFYTIFRSKLGSLLENLHAHRAFNFTGAMLQHHQMASTKYLSKYIEMKNLVADKKKERPVSGRSNPNKQTNNVN